MGEVRVVEVTSGKWSVDTGVILDGSKRYRFHAEGEWIDKDPPAVDAAGIEHPGGIRERLNWMKRLPAAPWMALLGRIDGDKWFVIGRDESVRKLPTGRLECCANDVIGSYSNNRGTILLTIREVDPGTDE